MPSRRVWLPRAGGRRAGRGERTGLGSAGRSLVMGAPRTEVRAEVRAGGVRAGGVRGAGSPPVIGGFRGVAPPGQHCPPGGHRAGHPGGLPAAGGEGFVGSRGIPGNVDRGFGP